jgi:hypothetical protein
MYQASDPPWGSALLSQTGVKIWGTYQLDHQTGPSHVDNNGAARITPNSRRLRLDHDWPWTQLVVDAINRVRTAFQALTVTRTPSAQAAL